jgi:hypothetical protein
MAEDGRSVSQIRVEVEDHTTVLRSMVHGTQGSSVGGEWQWQRQHVSWRMASGNFLFS